MDLLFAHDTRFAVEEAGTLLSPGTFGPQVWDRYLLYADRVRVMGRGRAPGFSQHREAQYYEPLSRPNVSFRLVPDVRAGLTFLARQRQLRQIAEQEAGQVDAVVARLPSETGLAAIRGACSAGKPWAVEVSGCAWASLRNYGGARGKVYAPIMWYRVRRVVKRAPFALYVTNRFLQQRYPCPNGCTIACSNVELPTPSKEVLERRLLTEGEDRAHDRKMVLGLIGSLHGRFKGIQTVLEALSHVRSELPPFQFRVLGVGDPAPWRALASEYGIDDAVSFDGTLPGGGPVFEWLDGIDVYLQPSLGEGLPRALVEAMSRGCPAIGSRVAGIPELLPSECLIRPGDARDLGRLLVRAAHDPAWRREQAVRNWDKATEYSRDVLEPKRREFWERFTAYAQAHNRKR